MEKEQQREKILNHPKPLSPNQRRAVLSDKQHIRIIAGAGAGKTETLTRRIVYHLIYEEIDPAAIVAFTFTDKAAEGMKSRIYDRLKDLGRDDLRARIGDLYVGTIHGYCFRLLTDYFNYGNHDVFDENQERAFLSIVGKDLGLANAGNYIRNCKNFLETVKVVEGELISDEVLQENSPDFLEKLNLYKSKLKENKRLTYDRMVSLAVENLEEKPDSFKHIKYLLVDEYQDINRAQEKLIQLIGRNAGIFIVGDPRQTIYKWRGSDETCFEDFAEIYPDAETIYLTENRRSGRDIIDLANSFADSFETIQYDHIVPTRTDNGIVAHMVASTDAKEAGWIATQIESYVHKGLCEYSDIGILLRSVSTSAPPFIDVFRDRGIPLIIGGGVGLFRKDEARAVGMLFSWLFEKSHWRLDPRRADTVIDGKDMLPFAINAWRAAVPYSLPNDMADKLKIWKSETLSGKFKHFTEAYQKLLNILGYLALDPEDPNQAVIMANLGRFNTILTDYETAAMLGGNERDWVRDTAGLFEYITGHANGTYDEKIGDDLRGINAVQLTTIHQAKGLEWPIVFMPALTSNRFPSKNTGKQKKVLIDRDLFDAARYEGTVEDERRLFYVAATRAKDVLVFSSFTGAKRDVFESSFVSDLPRGSYIELSEHDLLPAYEISKGADPEDIQTFSAGQIIAYKTCPYSYRLNHVWGYKPGFSEYLGYGKTLHFCLRLASDMIKNQGCSPVNAIETALDDHFFLPFIFSERSERIQQAARDKLIRFVKERAEDMKQIKEVEARVEFPLQKATVTGRIDVLLHDGNCIEIRDYKTSKDSTTHDDSSIQVQMYALGMSMIGEVVSKGSVAYLDDASLREVGVSDNDLVKAKEAAQRHIAGIITKDFTPQPGQHCQSCDYGAICRWKGC
ncbi:MAG: ATP-dependent helicase [Chloroflexi bacterium]|nr:ATP-dependent helicase [Chloroflexota bacterium]